MSDKKPPNPQASPGKYDVVVVTTGPSSDPESTPGSAPLKTVVKKAFDQLGITTALDTFTYANAAGTKVELTDKVEIACDGKSPCKIFATPIKAQDA